MSQAKFTLLALVGAVLCGCDHSGKYVPVSGVVTLNGSPLPGVMVTFQPMSSAKGGDAGGVGSYAMTDANGKFTLEASTANPQKGALVGKHKVRVATPPKGGANKDSDSAAGSSKTPNADPIPARYNAESTLEFEVPAGGTDKANLQLTSP